MLINGKDLCGVDKRKVLGENFLRMHGFDPAEVRKTIKGDDWDQRRPTELAKPWSTALALRQRVTT